MILDGTFAPGERLIEGHIAEQLGVSRNPVREAIRSLEATGLVEVIPRKGAHVSRIDVEEVRQIQELRSVIEPLAAELAAERRTDADVRQLTECIDRGLAATKSGDKVAAAAYHRDFHIAARARRTEPVHRAGAVAAAPADRARVLRAAGRAGRDHLEGALSHPRRRRQRRRRRLLGTSCASTSPSPSALRPV